MYGLISADSCRRGEAEGEREEREKKRIVEQNDVALKQGTRGTFDYGHRWKTRDIPFVFEQSLPKPKLGAQTQKRRASKGLVSWITVRKQANKIHGPYSD